MSTEVSNNIKCQYMDKIIAIAEKLGCSDETKVQLKREVTGFQSCIANTAVGPLSDLVETHGEIDEATEGLLLATYLSAENQIIYNNKTYNINDIRDEIENLRPYYMERFNNRTRMTDEAAQIVFKLAIIGRIEFIANKNNILPLKQWVEKEYSAADVSPESLSRNNSQFAQNRRNNEQVSRRFREDSSIQQLLGRMNQGDRVSEEYSILQKFWGRAALFFAILKDTIPLIQSIFYPLYYLINLLEDNLSQSDTLFKKSISLIYRIVSMICISLLVPYVGISLVTGTYFFNVGDILTPFIQSFGHSALLASLAVYPFLLSEYFSMSVEGNIAKKLSSYLLKIIKLPLTLLNSLTRPKCFLNESYSDDYFVKFTKQVINRSLTLAQNMADAVISAWILSSVMGAAYYMPFKNLFILIGIMSSSALILNIPSIAYKIYQQPKRIITFPLNYLKDLAHFYSASFSALNQNAIKPTASVIIGLCRSLFSGVRIVTDLTVHALKKLLSLPASCFNYFYGSGRPSNDIRRDESDFASYRDHRHESYEDNPAGLLFRYRSGQNELRFFRDSAHSSPERMMNDRFRFRR